MRLTLQIKLLPSEDQKKSLLNTIMAANDACNYVSQLAWEKKVFNQFKIHSLCYHFLKGTSELSAQVIVRCISKVAEAYKTHRNSKISFKRKGGITYDSRILTYKKNNTVNMWCIGGRQKIGFVCHNKKYFDYIKGECDLIYNNGKFYLFQCVDVPDELIDNVEDFIGFDFGVTDIVSSSDGYKYSAEWINKYREKRQKIRSSLQSKGTRNSKKLLKRLSGKERRTATIINHTIASQIVKSAKKQRRGISLEDLKDIRKNSTRTNRKFKSKLGTWSFYQLRRFIEYKARINGVAVVIVNPAYTSKTCSSCHHIGNRRNKSFKCHNCGNNIDADVNAAKNIATLGAVVNQPEKSNMFSCTTHYLGFSLSAANIA